MADKSFLNAVELLHSQGRFYIDLGLDRISKVLEAFSNPQDRLKCIHVAGTNGKGSVCAILNAVLQKNGIRTGLYTSPHIFSYTERIQTDGEKISEEEFASLVFRVVEVSDKIDVHLTEFEILTVVGFLYFVQKDVDIVLLETGLGGRFDATNVIKSNLCSIIVHIDLEHTDRLGDTIEKISAEKAGIIKENCPVIIAEENEVIKRVAGTKSAPLYMAKIAEEEFSLKGLHQKFNLGLAKCACEVLGIEFMGYENAINPCRFEYLKDYDVIVDCAHNPNGIEALRKNLDFYYPNQNFNFIFGCLKTKDYETMLKTLVRENDELFIFEFSYPNACKFEDFKAAKRFKEYKKNTNLTVICGSFYMLDEVFNALRIKYDKK